MYIIKRLDQGGGYLANPGSHNTYTRDLAKARIFYDRETAEKERCPGNETVVSVESILSRRN